MAPPRRTAAPPGLGDHCPRRRPPPLAAIPKPALPAHRPARTTLTRPPNPSAAHPGPTRCANLAPATSPQPQNPPPTPPPSPPPLPPRTPSTLSQPHPLRKPNGLQPMEIGLVTIGRDLVLAV